MKTIPKLVALNCCALATALTALNAYSAAITPGDVLVYRVGTGTGALGATATAVFIDEYSPLGTLVQSLPMPTTGSSALTATGNSSTEGVLSLSQDGTTAIFAGYRADVGAASPGGATVNRVIGTVNLAGTVSTSVAVTDAGTSAIRSATSTDGSSLFYIGTAGGVRYVGTPSGASTSSLLDNRNSRQVLLNGNTLFASNGSTSTTAKLQSYGTLPIGTTTPTPILTLATADAINGFAMFDLNPSVPGIDTIYDLSTVQAQLQKWTFDGTTWIQSGSIATATGQNVSGYVENGVVKLFITSPTTLYSEIDGSGPGGILSGGLTTIASAAPNEAFRGVVYIPEPSSVTLGLLMGGALLAYRFRKNA